MVAVSVSCLSSAYALARIGSAALGAMSEKPEIGGRALIFLGMAEGIAIYGLIVAIMLINRI
jgi:V/A-type H+-transporting ATPase subunit K